MRRIKSAPADICKMVNRKISKKDENNIVPILPLTEEKQENKSNILNNIVQINQVQINQVQINQVQKSKIQQKKEIILSKKQLTNTISGIISDAFSETNKYIPQTDNYYYQFIIECINNFLTNKFTWKNFENLIYSLIIRIIVSDIYHEVIIKVKENVHVIK
jgi:hypothetical protein